MTERWIVVVGLLVVVGALACSFSLDLGPEGGTPPVAATPTPATPRSDDDEYADCAQTVVLQWVELTGDVRQGVTQFHQDPGEDFSAYNLFCDEKQPSYKRRLHQIDRTHSGCPAPSDPHLVAAQRHIENGLLELEAAIAWHGKYCDEMLTWWGDPLPYEQGNESLRETASSADRAAEQLDQYNR